MKRLIYYIFALFLLAACSGGSLDDIRSRLDADEESLITLKERISAAENDLVQINSDLSSLLLLRGGVVVNTVSGSTAEGWTLTLSNGRQVSVPSAPDSFGNAPLVSVDPEGFWTVDYGNGPVYVLDTSGNRVSSIGHGSSGKAGENGRSPILGVDAEGYWVVRFALDEQWTYVPDFSGNPVKAVIETGDTLFEGVEVSANKVTISLKNGLALELPLVADFLCAIEGAGQSFAIPEGGTRTFPVQMKGVASTVVTCPNGWTASLQDGVLEVGAPVSVKAYFSTENTVAIYAVSFSGYSTISRIDVEAVRVIDEDILSQIRSYASVDATYSIENASVSAFMSEVDYGSSSWDSGSSVMDYVSVSTPYNKAKPAGIVLSWEGSVANPVLVMIDGDGNQTVTDLTGGTTACTISNLVPGKTWRYGIVSYAKNARTLLKKGAFSTTGQVRMINTNYVNNVRDLGGWTGLDGRKIVYGLIYRGAQLDSWTDGVRVSMLSRKDRNMLVDELGITSDIDLRSAGEAGNVTESPLGVEYNRFSVVQYYEGLVSVSSQALYRAAIEEVFSCVESGKAVFFHCLGGADRTGTLAMLLEGLLGVSESDIAKDYELTSFFSERRRNNYPVSGVNYLKGLGTNLNDGIYQYCTTVLGIDAAKIESFRSTMLKSTL